MKTAIIKNETLEVSADVVNIKVPDHWHRLLHRLWSKAVGGPDYVKAEWIELESILFQAAAKLPHNKAKAAAAGG